MAGLDRKICAYEFTNVGEGMGVNIFEICLDVSTNFKAQVCYRTQAVCLLEQTNGSAQA